MAQIVEIKEVKSSKDLDLFIQFPRILYKNCPFYVPALDSGEKKLLTKCLTNLLTEKTSQESLTGGATNSKTRNASVLLGLMLSKTQKWPKSCSKRWRNGENRKVWRKSAVPHDTPTWRNRLCWWRVSTISLL